MKTQIKRFSKSTLAVVLTICLLFSCLTVDIVATNAAQVASGSVGAYFSADTYYFDYSNLTWYLNDNCAEAYLYNAETSKNTYVSVAVVDATNHIASFTVPTASTYDSVIFRRYYTNSHWNDQTVDISFDSSYNCWQISSSKDNNGKYKGSWKNYTPPVSATTTLYVLSGLKDTSNNTMTNAYIWEEGTGNRHDWSGETMASDSNWSSETISGHTYYKREFTNTWSNFQVILNDGTNQTTESASTATGSTYYINELSSNTPVLSSSPLTASYAVTVNGGDHGSVSLSTVNAGSTAVDLSTAVTVTPDAGWVHSGWTASGNASVSGNNLTATGTDGSVTATYTADTYRTIYLCDKANWGSIDNLYLINSSTDTTVGNVWPGQEVSSSQIVGTIGGKNVYEVKLYNSTYSAADKLVMSKSEGSTQYPGTGSSLTLADGNIYYNDGTASTAYSSSMLDVTSAVTFYVCNKADWANVYYYTYGGGTTSGKWPGTEISSTAIGTSNGKSVYQVTITTSDSSITLNNNDGTQYPPNGTDMALTAGKMYYTDGTAAVTYSADLLDDTNTSGNYYVAGALGTTTDSDPGPFGVAWAPALTGNKMTETSSGSGIYQIVYSNVTTSGKYYFKVLENGSWTTAYPAENYTIKVNQGQTLTITIDTTNNAVSATVSGESSADLAVAGSAALVGSTGNAWNTSAFPMTKNGTTYTYTFTNVPKTTTLGDLAFQVVAVGTWNRADGTTDVNNVILSASNALGTDKDIDGNNIRFTTTDRADVTISYNSSTDQVTISAVKNTTAVETVIYANKDVINGLYVWTDTEEKPLGDWSATATNVSSVGSGTYSGGSGDLTGFTGTYVKFTFSSETASSFKFIARSGSSQSSDSDSYAIGGTYIIDSYGNVARTPGQTGGGSNTDSNWDSILTDENLSSTAILLSADSSTLTTFSQTKEYTEYAKDDHLYFKIPVTELNGTGNEYFMVSGSTDYKNCYYQSDSSKQNPLSSVSVGSSSTNYLQAGKQEGYGQESGVNTNTNYFFSYVKVKEDAVGTFSYIVLDVDTANKIFTYHAYGASAIVTKTKVYVEDGSYGYSSTYGTAAITTPSGLTYSSGTYYKIYNCEEGTELTVTTTLKAGTAKKGDVWNMYVFAYSVNGVKYEVTDNGNGTFTNTTPIVVGSEDIEITPIYYSHAIEDNGDYISIYVDADSNVIKHWGNQIYLYSYYYHVYGSSTSDADTGKGDGSYPGQALVLDASGYYYGKVAKTWYTNNFQTKDTAHPVSGVTFSGGYENNTPHQHFINYNQNRQSYDYDDFAYIAKLGDTVRFDLKYTANTTSSNQYQLVNNATGYPEPSKTFAQYDASTVQGWEYLYDFDYKPCSVLGLNSKYATNANGTWVSGDDSKTAGSTDNGKVKIISVGNQNKSADNVGKWATIWYVYKPDGTFLTKGLPSDFICRTDGSGNALAVDSSSQTEQWKAIVGAGLQYTAAEIAYETEMGAGTSVESGNSGVRIDGRWVYTLSTDANFEVHAGVAILNSDGTYTFDKNFNDATGTAKAAAYIDGSTTHNRNDNVSTKKFSERNVDATLTTDTESDGYYFLYWATVTGTYPADATVGSNLEGVQQLTAGTTPTTKFTASTDQFFVAVYKQITGGKLKISHDAYTAGGLTGEANRYVSAALLKADDSVVNTYSKTKGSVTLSGITNQMSSQGYKIRITLYGASVNSSIFNHFWTPANNATVSENPAYSSVTSANSKENLVCAEADPATYTLTLNVSDVWSIIEGSTSASADAYTISYKSDFNTGYKYQIVYTYTSRYWGDQTYTVKGTFTTEEFNTYVIDSSGTLTFDSAKKETFLAAHSPYEDNFKETVKWKFSAAANLTYDSGTKTFSTKVAAQNEANRTINIKFVFPFEYNDISKTGEGVYHIGDTDNEGKLVGLVPTKSAADDNKIMKVDTNNTHSFNDTLTYLDWYSLNDCKNAKYQENHPGAEPFLLEAPDKIYVKDTVAQGANQTYTEWTFQYWSLKTYPTDGSESVEYKRGYSRFFNLALYQSTIAEPIYKVVTDDNPQVKPAGGESATINFLENSRNQWNYGGGNQVEKVKPSWKEHGDRIFSDFVISFEYNGKELKKENKDNFKSGILIEEVDTLNPDAYGEVTTKTSDEYKAIYEKETGALAAAKGNAESLLTSGENYAQTNAAATLSTGGKTINYLIAGVADIKNLDDKNSIEYSYSFANISHTGTSENPTPTLRKNKIYRAFSYLYDVTKRKTVLSDPIYFTIYDIATIQSGEAYIAPVNP